LYSLANTASNPPNEALQERFSDAASEGNLESVTALLDQGASIQGRDADSYTALDCASDGGHVDVVRLLLSRGASDKAGQYTSIGYAAEEGRLDVVSALLAADGSQESLQAAAVAICATTRSKGAGAGPVFLHLLSCGMKLDVDAAGHSMLAKAALSGQVEVMRAILDAGYDVGVEENGCALIWAAGNGQIEASRMLIDAGMDIDLGHAAVLYSAVERFFPQEEMVAALLSWGADPSPRGYRAVRCAVEAGQVGMVTAFLRAGVEMGPIGALGDEEGGGKTLRDIAIGAGRPEVVAVIDAHLSAIALAAAPLQSSGAITQRPEAGTASSEPRHRL